MERRTTELRSAIDASLATGRPLAAPERAALTQRIAAGSGPVWTGRQVLHTEPHADDVALGYLPVLRREAVQGHTLALFTTGHRGVPDDWPEAGRREDKIAVRERETLHFADQAGLTDVRFLALPFYDRPGGKPDDEDLDAVVELLLETRPDVITLALDPPDGHATHVAVHQLIGRALVACGKQGFVEPRIIGYRDVWARFHLAEATHFIPVSEREMVDVEQLFERSYPSQAEQARRGGRMFSTVVREAWQTQLAELRTCLAGLPAPFGDDAAGAIVLRELTVAKLRAFAAAGIPE